ncbi:bifunctional [glutamine synthetase] adenylyltransferase/[glutamine synthetase]-adenylyl-L-tyrosine phosphorylase [Sphingomonas colocasiae]|uniref:Bifunctional [glutamine synthetase] adenylyltransferase/[glutamine synthetase]-adenylyl-L-tyrosine phosphorylase n=1 Tax=Sphingomonas colocasiae TaxID=1848973 RepID=A0ABS7PX67_9SPHN|nr:bifunctional [glutamine synthetase] adenylyltransferase/[glutamine synthetase]-adenylyl-L-tyrosine phosphorylase [Sphingomonas colocasiae]MBY8825955.1 bifunctional [glutamine synthetase] adenylyltransferase/[glutamine synthetase]-adenylyl-L-tyrosine phosphorylase [Sphingomonas colocasiae]
MNPNEAIVDALQRAADHSPFLRHAIERNADLTALLAAGDLDGAMALAKRRGEGAESVGAGLRRARAALALVLAIGDLAGLLSMEVVTRELSDLADRALDRAIAAAIAERTPDEAPRGFAALALGKHGSRELNYSSDIDPILIFDPETLPRRAREEPVEAAVRIARRIVELLQSRDGDGYVFRVDLRLRPSPEATPLALPVNAAISHYESSALPWERAAFIRARAAAGDVALGESFLTAIRPFVWRRGLDYGAIAEIRGISRRIRDHHAQGQKFGPGYDLKRGRGGIREVEFFAQIHQLIYGGREEAVRAPATLDALAALRAAGRIEPDVEDVLAHSYRLYRTIEHRLQMVDDQQTHSLPRDPAALDSVARLHGLADGAALIDLLDGPVETVGRIYDSLDGTDEEDAAISRDPDRLTGQLAAAGFADPKAALARIERWRDGSLRALRTDAARAALEDVLPGLVAAIGGAPDPNGAINRLDDMISRLPSAINLFRLLGARPALARLLGEILSHAPTLADLLGRRPELLDGLIDATALEPQPSVEALASELGHCEQGADYQQLLDSVRRKVNERRFALGAQIVAGVGDPVEVGYGYSRVAEAAIETLAAATVAEFEAVHGKVPDSELVIVGLGRLGGGSLTHASDLDLVYVFTGDHAAESTGAKPLGAVQYYNRLCQRISAALSVPTASGPLYEVDTRLRPSGAQGPLAVSLAGFAKYQRESAWTWEHMALTRARPVFGSATARGAINEIIHSVLGAPRDVAKLLADAVAMRGEMAKHKPAAGPLDVKLIEGGLVDLEFCVHVAQLRHGEGLDTRLDHAIAMLVDAGRLPAALAEAQVLLTRMLVTLRLVAPGCDELSETARRLVARACGMEDWASLMAAYERARGDVGQCWQHVVAEAEEMR